MVVNVVLAVLLDEFLKAANKEKYVRFMQLHTSDGTASQYVSILDPFLKYFVDCYDSWEMKERVDEILNELMNLQDEREDRIGAIMRIIKFQRANAKLTEEQELELIDSRNLQIVISEVKELKKWMVK